MPDSAIAQEVSAFYERHPYPLPVDDLERYRRSWDDDRRRLEACMFWPDEPYRDDRSILVAGCGTSQAAKVALRWPNSQVIGIDVSATSIEHTDRLRRKHRIGNLQLLQLPLERAGELARDFGYVICTGVLHHLGSPDLGLRELRKVLAPKGAMHLMVYAPYGRAGVYLLQDYCRRLRIGISPSEIRDLAASLQALPPDHPLQPLLRHAPDFSNDAGLADSLLHPQDRAYSVPELLEFLDNAGLKFGRWLRQAPYLPQCGSLASVPHSSLLRRLPIEEQYAAVELFRGTMIRHSFVAYRCNRPLAAMIDFGGVDWPEYVPLRVSNTVLIDQRLPPGTAAVLINKAHTYSDIYLPITSQQREWFEAIDGERNIGEIIENLGAIEAARVLFRGLWWYDQVLFDLSQKAQIRQSSLDTISTLAPCGSNHESYG